jgi:hypothetical protein
MDWRSEVRYEDLPVKVCLCQAIFESLSCWRPYGEDNTSRISCGCKGATQTRLHYSREVAGVYPTPARPSWSYGEKMSGEARQRRQESPNDG